MAIYVIGDIHGRHDALTDVLYECDFLFYKDTLITLGDIVDGGAETRQCFDTLLEVKNHISILGNHDAWFLDWIKTGRELPIWIHQGGLATVRSYTFDRRNVPCNHIGLLEKSVVYYLDDKNRIFVHGGFDPNLRVEYQDPDNIMWDRNLIYYARGEWDMKLQKFVDGRVVPFYDKVFVGHTSTQLVSQDVNDTVPGIFNNLIALDTGAGWNGKLTIMDVDTLEYWQSGVQYPNI